MLDWLGLVKLREGVFVRGVVIGIMGIIRGKLVGVRIGEMEISKILWKWLIIIDILIDYSSITLLLHYFSSIDIYIDLNNHILCTLAVQNEYLGL